MAGHVPRISSSVHRCKFTVHELAGGQILQYTYSTVTNISDKDDVVFSKPDRHGRRPIIQAHLIAHQLNSSGWVGSMRCLNEFHGGISIER